MADNLVQRGGLWHVRLDIPKDVRAAFGHRKILSKSLETGSRAEAMCLRLPLLAQWKAEIRAVREKKASQADEWRLSIHESGLRVQDERKEVTGRLFTPGQPSTSDSDLTWIHEAPEIAADLVEAGRPDLAERIQKWANSYLEKLESGFDHASGIASQNELISIQAEVSAAATVIEYDLSEDEAKEARDIVLNPSRYKPKSPITRPMLDGWAAHLVTQIETPKSRDTMVSRVQRFSDFLTAQGLPLGFDAVHGFLKTLPPARQTKANYLWSGRTFWKWANKYNPAFRDQFSKQPCPFDGHDLPKTGDASGKTWKPFEREEVERLHAEAMAKGDVELAHLIALAAFTGARLEELGRIKPSQDTIFSADGRPIGFRINEAKTEAGIREVPLHPSIVPLYIKLSASAAGNGGYLFSGGQNKYGNRLDGHSKRFGRLKTKIGFSELHCFHSIRKTTVTELHNRGVTVEVLPFLVGHETGSFTLSVYSKGASFKQKQEAINLLEFCFTY